MQPLRAGELSLRTANPPAQVPLEWMTDHAATQQAADFRPGSGSAGRGDDAETARPVRFPIRDGKHSDGDGRRSPPVGASRPASAATEALRRRPPPRRDEPLDRREHPRLVRRSGPRTRIPPDPHPAAPVAGRPASRRHRRSTSSMTTPFRTAFDTLAKCARIYFDRTFSHPALETIHRLTAEVYSGANKRPFQHPPNGSVSVACPMSVAFRVPDPANAVRPRKTAFCAAQDEYVSIDPGNFISTEK